ncbi:MAG: hypothetical protein DME47_03845 [Verrucomicrobia bacterium]|nr:MAG: hypothetical protein DME47_03845 [Verrucomicrobiota bacterium]
MIQLWKLSGANAMLPLVHRSPFRRVFLVFVFLLSGSISAVRASAPTPTPTPTPGQLDPTFVPAPGTNDAVNVVIPQPDGKVIAAGRFTFANNVARNRIARFNFNGSLDTTFDPGTGADGEITAAVLQPDGRIVVAGRFTSFNGFTHNRVCRLNANGSVDQTFGLGNGINNAALALALQSDGRIIVGGQFTQVDLTLRNNLARLNTNGSVDLSFDPGIGPSGDVNAIVIQPDGRIIIGGTFIGYNGFARGGIARVLGNGALDPSFDSGVGTGGNVFALALQHNGQIVLGGRFVQYSGTNRTFIARVFGDGSLDFGFNPVPNSWVQSFAVEPDDRILVGGIFTDISGFGRNSIARLNTNGLVDPTFDPGAGCVGSLTNDATRVDSIALQQFGRILVGGIFTSYNNQLRDNMVRLFDNAAPAAYDFNQDGKPDYVLFNAVTHQTAVWYLNNNVFIAIWYLSGTILVSGAFGPTLPNGWDLIAVGDFNADGKPDYVLYAPATRQIAVWYLNNNAFVSGVFGPTLPVNWRVVGVADFNGDNKPDYLLFNSSTRQTAIWYLSGSTLVAGAFGPSIVSGYSLIGAADFDRDGKPDYALYSSAVQRTAVWYLNNNVFVGGAYGPSLPANWSLIAP